MVDASRADAANVEHDYLKDIVPEAVNINTEDESRRLGRSSSKPRPLRIDFASENEKHVFLKQAKTLRQAGIKCNDFLIRLQQQERQVFSGAFNALKANGHRPFFGGSELKYYPADQMRSCSKIKLRKPQPVVEDHFYLLCEQKCLQTTVYPTSQCLLRCFVMSYDIAEPAHACCTPFWQFTVTLYS